ncbi:hypothetical protein C3F00_018815 [Pseudomonas sp. MWU13-2860]|nr:hypothetical protein C3F00_018815 [Pseudomonas sp. MWU13-2860]
MIGNNSPPCILASLRLIVRRSSLLAIRVWRLVRQIVRKLCACLQGFVHAQGRFMAAVRGRPSGLPAWFVPVRQPAYSCHLFVWRRSGGDPLRQTKSYPHEQIHTVNRHRLPDPQPVDRR